MQSIVFTYGHYTTILGNRGCYISSHLATFQNKAKHHTPNRKRFIVCRWDNRLCLLLLLIFFLVSLGKKELDHQLAAVREMNPSFPPPPLFSRRRKTESKKAGRIEPSPESVKNVK